MKTAPAESRIVWSAPACPRPSTPRTKTVAQWFGLESKHFKPPAGDLPGGSLALPLPERGEILLITGPSGSGKTSLLRSLRANGPGVDFVALDQLVIPDRAVVDCLEGLALDRALGLLSRVGLAEAWTYLHRPDQLSEGQRWRLRLAMALQSMTRCGNMVLVADEFAAVLDRVTASVVARALRRVVSSCRGRAIVATSHNDLLPALLPDRLVHCDFGRVRITPAPTVA